MVTETIPRVTGGSSDRDLEPGQRVGEYVVESTLGKGGFGTVYRARHPLIGKLAAIKVLSRQYSADPEIVARFVDEARAVNQIRHRNIIDIFSFGKLDDERSYYVMELLDGQPLDRLLDDAGPCSLPDTIPILRGIARALDAAHASGVAHRDLKPENVFLARESDGSAFPKLLDFGIAKLFGDRAAQQQHRTRTGSPMGTPDYMSPEQCRGRDVDHRTDYYAFGCVAYKLLTGVVPFDGDNHLDVLMKQLNDEPVPPSQRVADLPPAVDDVIAWLMRKEPGDRPPDLITAVRALEDIATGAGLSFAADAGRRTPSSVTPVPSRPSAPRMLGSATPTPAPAPRSRATLAILAVIGAAIAGAIVTIALTRDDDPPPPPPPAAPVAAPPVAMPDAAPAASTLVTIEITGAPAGTEVYGPAGPLGPAPGPIQLVRGPDDVQLTLKADGYETATTRVKPDRDRTIEVALTAKPAPAAPAKKRTSKRPVSRPKPPAETGTGAGSGSGSAKRPSDPFGRK